MHRSIDEGATWTRINDDAHEYGGPGNGQFVMGDMNVYGRVYMSTVGSGIAYGEITDPLPITFASFSGLLNKNNGANLKWKTVTETNNNYFDIERSLDGRSFAKINTVASKAVNGNSTAALEYAYTDDVKGIKGAIYYRLKQVDKDGKFAYSNTINLNKTTAGAETIKAFPNPANANNINLKIELNTSQNVQVNITDMSGAIVYKAPPVKLSEGTSLLKIKEAANLNKGIYIIELRNAGNNNRIGRDKIIIQ